MSCSRPNLPRSAASPRLKGGLDGFEPDWVAKADLCAKVGAVEKARRAYGPAARACLIERLAALAQRSEMDECVVAPDAWVSGLESPETRVCFDDPIEAPALNPEFPHLMFSSDLILSLRDKVLPQTARHGSL
jgi:hypothetical protein